MKDWGDLNRLQPPQARTASERACIYLLERLQRDANLYYHVSPGTGAFDMLCLAEAEILGQPVEAVRERRSHCFDDRESDREKDARRIEELEREVERGQ
jgi:hypothetical protein